MNISLNWLTDYVDVSIGVAELAEHLTRIGLCVEEVVESDDDIVLDVEVTSNRSDCLGHLGVAREVAAVLGVALCPPPIGEIPTAGRADELTSVEVLDGDLCPRYTARVLRGVKVGPSPAWLVERLAAVGLRSVNNVVDVTNYVLMEYAQPLHSFDYDKLHENRIVVRRARDGERMVSIDETKCHLDHSMLVIADADRPVAVAGIMGGLDTEVGESTTTLLLESAQFDPLNIRRTSRKLALMSESNYRFERGVDPVGVDRASLRACELIVRIAGGQLADGIVDVWQEPFRPRQVTLRTARCDHLLGVSVPVDRQVEILAALGLGPRLDGGRIACTIPPWRADLSREVDLIEEIARLYGFDNIPVSDRVTHSVLPQAEPQRVRREVGRLLAAAGFDEALTLTFIDADEAALFGQDDPVHVDPLTRRSNNVLRPTLLGSLLRACKTNQDVGNAEVSLWEVASVFPPSPRRDALPRELTQIALVTTRDLTELRGAIESLIGWLAPQGRLDIEPADVPGLDARAATEIRLDGRGVGTLGTIAPGVQDHYGLERRVAAATVRFDVLLAHAGEKRTYQPLPKFPPVRRDLSVIVDEGVTWRELLAAIDRVDQPLREGVEYVTTYRGRPIPDDKKSVTLALVYRWADGTLRRLQVDEQVAALIAALKQETGADVRTQDAGEKA